MFFGSLQLLCLYNLFKCLFVAEQLLCLLLPVSAQIVSSLFGALGGLQKLNDKRVLANFSHYYGSNQTTQK